MIDKTTEFETEVVFFDFDDMPVFGIFECYSDETDHCSIIVRDNYCPGSFYSLWVIRGSLYYSDLNHPTD